jgi:chemotaxis protein methyltransferase CheR
MQRKRRVEGSMDEESALKFFIKLVYERSRINLNENKYQLIKARIGKRMLKLGFERIEDYATWLQKNGDESEIENVINVLTTNYTLFLREEDHFKFLVNEALPKFAQKKERVFNIWSAACATGEEPYSLVFYLNEYYPISAGWSWHILASDISTKALATASRGIYPEEKVESLPQNWLRKYFQKGFGPAEGYYRVKPEWLNRVEFRQINLIENLRVQQVFHVIFCRNVMIYFDRDTQVHVVNQLLEKLCDGGYFIVGHAESLTGFITGLKCIKPSIYCKE